MSLTPSQWIDIRMANSGMSFGAFTGSWTFPLHQAGHHCMTNHETPTVKIMESVKLSVQS